MVWQIQQPSLSYMKTTKGCIQMFPTNRMGKAAGNKGVGCHDQPLFQGLYEERSQVLRVTWVDQPLFEGLYEEMDPVLRVTWVNLSLFEG